MSLDDIVKYSAWCVNAVATGVIDFKTAREVQYGLATMHRALEKRELLQRIKDLETQLAALKKASA